MPGRIEAKDLPALYRAAALFIYPSLMEGFGLPPAEAMAVGTPDLVSNTLESSQKSCASKVVSSIPAELPDLESKLLLAAQNEMQFKAELSQVYTEEFGIKHYLDLIPRATAQKDQ